MLTRETIEAIRNRVAPHDPPVLSLYLNVNPAETGNQHKAAVLRARAALDGLQLPAGLKAEVLRRLDQEHVIPGGRSLVVFAGEDPDELFEVTYLHQELPMLDLDSSEGALARWGEPFTAPLLFAVDQTERYAAIYVSQQLVRVFEVFMGDIEDAWSSERDLDTEEWKQFSESKQSPAVGKPAASRGGRDVDTFTDRVEQVTARFYSGVVSQFEDSRLNSQADRIMLLGTPDAVTAFFEALPPQLQERVVARLPAPADDQMAAADWYPLLSEAIREAEATHEQQLLDQIRERGSWGLSEVLGLLNNGQADVLVMPWHVGQTVWLARESGVVATDPTALQTLQPDDSYAEVKLKDALPGIVQRSSVRVEFVDGASAERLRDEFAGIAVLRRW